MGSSKKTTTSNATSSATTTPNVPDYALGPTQDYYSQIGSFGSGIKADPYQFTTPATDLQNQAYGNASTLGGWSPLFAEAVNMARGSTGGPNFASMPQTPTAQGWNAQGGQALTYNAPQVQSVSGPNVTQASASTYSAPTLGAAQGYSVPSMNPQAAQAMGAGVSAPTLDPAALAEAAKLGDVTNVQATKAGPAASLLDNFSSYAAPTTQALVDSSLADYDHQAAVDRNRMEAAAGGNKAFGGSGWAIQQAEYDANSNRNRALTAAQLRDNAFARQAGLAESDAGRRQQTSLFDATNLYDAAKTNAATKNAFTLQDAANRQQTGLANQQALNDRNLTQGQLSTQAGIASSNNQTQASIANANSQNSRDALIAGLQADAGKFLAGETNTNQRLNADYAARAGEFGANANNTVNLANQSAQNNASNLLYQGNLDRARQQADLTATASRDNTAAGNNFLSDYLAQTNLAGRDRATAQNGLLSQAFGMEGDMNRFNATQRDNVLARQLQAAGLLGQLGATAGDSQRADIATQLGAGQNQWDIQNNRTMAPLNLLQMYGSLLDPQLMSQVTGQTVNGTQSGTEVSKSSGGLLGTLGGIAKIAATVAPMMSDRRLKTNIERVGELPDGLGVYEYDYVWGGPRQRGVMADEVAKLRPWALGPEIAGYASVNYGAL